jgi:hypothetical protein
MLSATTLAIACVVLAAAFLQGTAGFGFIFFSLPILAWFIDFRLAVVTLMLLAQVLNLLILWQHGFRADWKSVVPLTVATLPGIPVGVWLLTVLPVIWLQGALGALLVFYALHQWLVRPAPRRVGPVWMALAGFTAGCLGGALSAQGPPILVYVSLQPWDKDRIKATLVGFFCTTGLFVGAMQAWQGLVTPEAMRLALVCAPFMIAGVLAGRRAYLRLGDGAYRALLTALVFALGLMLLGRSLGF